MIRDGVFTLPIAFTVIGIENIIMYLCQLAESLMLFNVYYFSLYYFVLCVALCVPCVQL